MSKHHVVDGQFVSEKHLHVAELLNEYDDQLTLEWIPPDKRAIDDDKPFAVRCTPTNGDKPYYVTFVTEDEVDERLLAFVIANDMAKAPGGPKGLQAHLDAQEAARQAMKMKQDIEREEERLDLIKHIVRSPLSRYRHNGVTYE